MMLAALLFLALLLHTSGLWCGYTDFRRACLLWLLTYDASQM